MKATDHHISNFQYLPESLKPLPQLEQLGIKKGPQWKKSIRHALQYSALIIAQLALINISF